MMKHIYIEKYVEKIPLNLSLNKIFEIIELARSFGWRGELDVENNEIVFECKIDVIKKEVIL